MRIATKVILSACLIIFSITAAGVYIIYTSPQPTTNKPPITPPVENTNANFSSFENSMDNWTTNGADLTDPTVNWSITPSTNQPYYGNYSLQLTLDNLNDQGKIWIEHQYNVQPTTAYHIIITYMLGTTDYGMNPFRIITGVTGTPPSKDNLTFQDDTSNGRDNNTFTWLPKTYEFITTSSPDGVLTASIGIWGTWETNRTYYLDNINVTIQTIPPTHNLPNIAGIWTISTYYPASNITSTTNATLTQNTSAITLAYDDGTTTYGILTPNVLTYTPMSTAFIISGLDLHGQHPTVYINNDTAMTASTTSSTLTFTKIKS